MKLTDEMVKATKKRLGDGQNLWIYPTGKHTRSWILRYQFQRRNRELGLGPYPEVSLQVARKKAAKMRALIAQGIDPIDHREACFESIAASFIRVHRHYWMKEHTRKWIHIMRTYAFPTLGSMPVQRITHEHIEAITEKLWAQPKLAQRIEREIEVVLRYAIAKGHRKKAP